MKGTNHTIALCYFQRSGKKRETSGSNTNIKKTTQLILTDFTEMFLIYLFKGNIINSWCFNASIFSLFKVKHKCSQSDITMHVTTGGKYVDGKVINLFYRRSVNLKMGRCRVFFTKGYCKYSWYSFLPTFHNWNELIFV